MRRARPIDPRPARLPRGPAVRAGGNLTPIEFEFGIAKRVVNDDAAAAALRAALASSRKRPLQLGGAALAAGEGGAYSMIAPMAAEGKGAEQIGLTPTKRPRNP